MKKNMARIGALMVLAAGLLWSTNAPFVSWLTVDAFTVAGLRSLIAGIVLLPFFRPSKIKWGRDLLCFLLCFTALTIGVIWSIKTTSAPIAVGMQYTSGLWLFVCSRPQKRDFALAKIWPLLVLTAGVVISMFSKADGVTMLGNIVALTTGLSFAGMTHFAKKINTDNPIGLSALSNLFAGIIALIIAHPAPAVLLSIDLPQWLVLLYLGAFQIGAAYALYYSGLRYTEPSTATMLAPIEMILAPVWTAVFLQKYPDMIGLTGFILVIIGVMGEAIRSSRSAEKQTQNT